MKWAVLSAKRGESEQTMKIKERIEKALKCRNFETDNIDKIIAIAYYMGKEKATKEICDRHKKIFDEQKERAKKCRYHKMAMEVIGNERTIYSDDYSNDITKTFGDDDTEK